MNAKGKRSTVYTKSLAKAQKKYNKENMEYLSLKLHKRNDADIIKKLASKNNKQGYIKELIRADG